MAEKAKKGLGLGLGALIPENFDSSFLVEADERVQKLAVAAIEPDAAQPRRHFDEAALEELARSIKNHGILQPLVVVAQGDKYQIIAGERRWRAAKKAGLKQVPAIVRSLKELERLEIALVENVQREDLAPLEQAASIERLHEQFSMSYETIAQRLGKAPSTVNNIVRLLQLPTEAREALSTKSISEGHARAILALKDRPAQQKRLLEMILRQGWSVRQAERYVGALKEGAAGQKAARERVSTETPQTKRLSKRLGAPVHIKRTARGGKLEVSFKNDEELVRIIDRLSQ